MKYKPRGFAFIGQIFECEALRRTWRAKETWSLLSWRSQAMGKTRVTQMDKNAARGHCCDRVDQTTWDFVVNRIELGRRLEKPGIQEGVPWAVRTKPKKDIEQKKGRGEWLTWEVGRGDSVGPVALEMMVFSTSENRSRVVRGAMVRQGRQRSTQWGPAHVRSCGIFVFILRAIGSQWSGRIEGEMTWLDLHFQGPVWRNDLIPSCQSLESPAGVTGRRSSPKPMVVPTRSDLFALQCLHLAWLGRKVPSVRCF
jgi:hypothetical protein